MKILWCVEHGQAEDGEGLCHRGRYLTLPCRMVKMLLVPDESEPDPNQLEVPFKNEQGAW